MYQFPLSHCTGVMIWYFYFAIQYAYRYCKLSIEHRYNIIDASLCIDQYMLCVMHNGDIFCVRKALYILVMKLSL